MSEMLLCIDAGNTRIKWGLRDGSIWHSTGFVDTLHGAKNLPQWDSFPQRIIISNVAGQKVEADIVARFSEPAAQIHIARAMSEQCGVRNSYRNPGQLGSDRWAALIGAFGLGPGAKLVVVAGTAMTVDALTEEGVFLGGVIVPGLMLMQRALHAGAAQLGMAPGQVETFPKETADAISSGVMHASVGAVMRMKHALRAHIGKEPECIVSGGGAPFLMPHLPFPIRIQDNLVLEGLAIIAKEVFD